MTKWFDTNYHYIVPEIADGQKFVARPQVIVSLVEEARAQGPAVRPCLVGPVTVLALSKQAEGSTGQPLDRLDELVESYLQVLAALADAGVAWVQLAEPATVADLAVADDAHIAAYLEAAYTKILAADNRPQVYVTTPYGSARAGLDALAKVAPEAVNVDLSVCTQALDADYVNRVHNSVDTAKTQLVTGLVDSRNVWAGNLRALREVFEQFEGASVSSTVSLQHVPQTVEAEPNLPVDVATWFSFANEKIGEVVA